jgi:hypothetical protein
MNCRRSGNNPDLTDRGCARIAAEVNALDAKNITYVRRPNSFRLTVDKEMIDNNADIFTTLATLVKKSWAARTA